MFDNSFSVIFSSCIIDFTSGDKNCPLPIATAVLLSGFSNSVMISLAGSSVIFSCFTSSVDTSPSPAISKIAIGSPTFAISSFCLRIFTILPETGVGTSESTLSVAISTTLSSSFTLSPSLASQFITVASITPSPIDGSNNLYSAISYLF